MNPCVLILTQRGNALSPAGDQAVLEMLREQEPDMTDAVLSSGPQYNKLNICLAAREGNPEMYTAVCVNNGSRLLLVHKSGHSKIVAALHEAINTNYKGTTWDLFLDMLGIDEYGNKLNITE